VTLVSFPRGETRAALELPLDPRQNRTGDVWHVLVNGLDFGLGYGFRVGKSPNLEPRIHRFDPRRVLLDPYARAVAGLEAWGGGTEAGAFARLGRVQSVVIDEDFDWKGDQPLNRPLAESIIYEMHVRSFTCHPSSGVAHPGTYRGLVEKIPYLNELGVTAVELMPVTEFEESDHYFKNPGRASGFATSGAISRCRSSLPRPRTRRVRTPRRRCASSRRWCRPSIARVSR
jgi:glycogen operon protein